MAPVAVTLDGANEDTVGGSFAIQDVRLKYRLIVAGMLMAMDPSELTTDTSTVVSETSQKPHTTAEDGAAWSTMPESWVFAKCSGVAAEREASTRAARASARNPLNMRMVELYLELLWSLVVVRKVGQCARFPLNKKGRPFPFSISTQLPTVLHQYAAHYEYGGFHFICPRLCCVSC